MIGVDIGKTKIRYTWKDELPSMKGCELWIDYGEDISQTPRHIANFMFALIMLDAFIWCKVPVVFDELTLREKKCLEDHFFITQVTKGCCGNFYPAGADPRTNLKATPIHVKKIVEDTPIEGSNTVLVSHGLGKDALNCACFTQEIGYPPRFILVGRHIHQDEGWRDRLNTVKQVEEIKGIPTSLVLTNFFKVRAYSYKSYKQPHVGFYPYYFTFPLSYKYNSNVTLSGVEIHNSKVRLDTMEPACLGESVFGSRLVSEATDIRFSSLTRPTTEYGSQKIFSERYPELKHLQRSCDRGLPYCNTCSKCKRTALNLMAMGRDPADVGLIPYVRGDLPLHPYHRHKNPDHLIENKLFDDPYMDWVEGANQNIFPLIWEGREIKKIMQEHLPLYKYDPGIDERGYTLTPSKWGKWIEKGLPYYMRHPDEA